MGAYVYATSHLVRFSDYHPAHHTEEYFYNVLLDRVPFCSEAELLSPLSINPSQSYFFECRLRNILTCVEDLEHHISTYGARHLWREEQRQQLVDLILQNHPIDELPILGGLPDEHASMDRESVYPSVIEEDTLEMLGLVNEFADKRDATLTPDQQLVFLDLDGATGLHVLSGAPGSGKTFLTQFLEHKWRSSDKKVLLLATTGAAAVCPSVTANTVHSVFCIPVDGRPLSPMMPTDPLFSAILYADIIVIDETSMLTAHVFSLVLYRLGLIVGCPYNALRAKLLLLVGDHAQLPAVCHCYNSKAIEASQAQTSSDKDRACGNCHISSSIWWSQVTMHHLTSSVCHALDPMYLQFKHHTLQTPLAVGD
jgi:hypothetical protein